MSWLKMHDDSRYIFLDNTQLVWDHFKWNSSQQSQNTKTETRDSMDILKLRHSASMIEKHFQASKEK